MGRIILGAILGGVLLFMWGWVWWMALPKVIPLQQSTMLKFKSETAVEEVVKANAPESGVYVLPNYHSSQDDAGKKIDEEACVQFMKGNYPGPVVFASIHIGAVPPMQKNLIYSLVGNILAAGIVTWLLRRSTQKTFLQKVCFVKSIAIVAAIMCIYPGYVWQNFTLGYTLFSFLELVIGWGLTGSLLAESRSSHILVELIRSCENHITYHLCLETHGRHAPEQAVPGINLECLRVEPGRLTIGGGRCKRPFLMVAPP